MEERDGIYLARLKHEGQAEKAPELRAPLLQTHPHYKPKTAMAPEAASYSPEPNPAKPLPSGGGTGVTPTAGAGAGGPSYRADSFPTPVPGPCYHEVALAGAGADGPKTRDMRTMP